MGLTVFSDEQRPYIKVIFERPWSWDDFEALHAQVTALLNAARQTMPLIIDAARAGAPPPQSLPKIGLLFGAPHPRLERVIVVGANLYIRKLFDSAQRLHPATPHDPQIMFVDTLEGALALISTTGDAPPVKATTVRVEPIAPEGTLKMTWERVIDARDIDPAFRAILRHAAERRAPFYVVVDIQADPRFPLMETMTHALRIQRLPELHGWLVVGQNSMARQIAHFLTKVSRQEKIRWFATMDEVQAFLNAP